MSSPAALSKPTRLAASMLANSMMSASTTTRTTFDAVWSSAVAVLVSPIRVRTWSKPACRRRSRVRLAMTRPTT